MAHNQFWTPSIASHWCAAAHPTGIVCPSVRTAPPPLGRPPIRPSSPDRSQPSSQGVTFQTRGVGINFKLNLTVLARLIQGGILRTLRGAPEMCCGPRVRGTV